MSINPLIQDRRTGRRPAGRDKGPWLAALEQGANLLQGVAPMHGFDVYVVGFHCAKGMADMQMEAHHYCRVVNGDFLQCVLFDGNTKDANLIGIEYIVSEGLFETMPEEEKSYWHPHNYELLSGDLVAPGLPEVAEKAFFRQLVNSYGKTWHTWHTADVPGHPAMPLPFGDPTLMWSFNRDGECDEALQRERNEAMGLDRDAKRAARQSLVELAHPQWGVDAMKDQFSAAVAIPGVVDVRSVER
jgi:hypothetical protein